MESKVCDCENCGGAVILDWEDVVIKKLFTDRVLRRVYEAVERGVRPPLLITTIAESDILRPLELYKLYQDLPSQ